MCWGDIYVERQDETRRGRTRHEEESLGEVVSLFKATIRTELDYIDRTDEAGRDIWTDERVRAPFRASSTRRI